MSQSFKPLIAPSILAADFSRLGEEVRAVLAAGADWIHFDVMDNHYVPNLSVGPLVLEALRKADIDAFMDVHLMVEPAERLIDDFAAAGANLISIHPESVRHLDRALAQIKEHGIQAGVVLNPATSIEVVDWVMDKLDLILVMSVNPGFGGQAFIPAMLEKLRQLRSRIDANGRPIRLEIDGGIKTNNIAAAAAAGADTFVAGSAIFGSADYAQTIALMREQIATAS
ncbi:MAG: ribulose-phosphate 3-epimerase [Xanthomonadales bacterium]|nr:ribulose-phosphate 3-epimerase [Xanthomonadales bacterium]